MAFIASTAFEARITNNDRDNLANIAGLYEASGDPADCSAGLLCVRSALAPCEGFSGVDNENTWVMEAATDAATIDDVIYACNPYDNQLITAPNGNNYFIGTATLGLGVPAGRYGNFTAIYFDGQHHYRFGEGNLSAALSTNTFFTIDDGLLVPAASAPATAGSIYFKLLGTGKFVEGTSDSFGYVDVLACKVSA